MGSPAEATPPEFPSSPAPALTPGGASGPVAVVWCRQVDNEAESPGYSTIPDDFPGRRETLDLIRVVGNLTVNIADTHDYWTPGPPQTLSYYPNLFLYPAFAGRYTCIGRMFLSTEDRPRLGMKTLVLDSSQLLASGEFGPAVLRWHASMSGPRADNRRPPVPDPALYGLLGEGLLFHRGSTEPVVAVASEQWEAAMEVVFDLVRSLPAALLLPGAILAFPYFLPQPKTNLHEFAEQIPLALALMRVPPSEAVGDRHRKRLQSWESTPFTFRDLTGETPPPGRGKENGSQVLQYIRDHNSGRLAPIVQRVDLVELPKLTTLLHDPERQNGQERRKEMWRIGTAMETAALLLQRGRGRHVPVSAEGTRRAQEYLQVTLPGPGGEASTPSSDPLLTAEGVGATPAPPSTGAKGLPSWLAKGAEGTALPPKGAEVIPVSVSEDPSMLAARSPSAEGEVGSGSLPRAGAGTLASLQGAQLTREVEAAIGRVLGPRLHQLEEELLRRLASELSETVTSEVDRRVELAAETKFRALAASSETRVAKTLTDLDTRWQSRLGELDGRLAAAGKASELSAELARRLAEASAQEEHALAEATTLWARKLSESEEKLRRELSANLAQMRGAISGAAPAELDRRLRAALDRELADPATGTKGSIAARIDTRIDQAVRLASQGALGQLSRSLAELENRWQEKLRLAQASDAPLTPKATEGVRTLIDRRLTEFEESYKAGLGELRDQLAAGGEAGRAELASELERLIHATVATEAEARGESEERLRQSLLATWTDAEAERGKPVRELDSRLSALIETRAKEMSSRLQTATRELEARLQKGAEERARELEGRLTKSVEERLSEGRESQAHADADLQVRLQSYTDQKIRETEDRLRGTTVELLARLRSDVESTVSRVPDPARLEASISERLQRAVDAGRSEVTVATDQRVRELEDQYRHRETEALQRLEGAEQDIKSHTRELLKVEQAARAELDDLDRRLLTLSDRLLPIVRKTWLRVAEIERGPVPADLEPRLNQLRREFKEELRRLEAELGEKTRDIRDRMESTIAHQGKVWLTMVRQLSQLTDERRSERARAFPTLAASPVASADQEELEEEEEEPPEEPPPPRRRSRREGRGYSSR